MTRVGWVVLGCVALSSGWAGMAAAHSEGDCHKVHEWSDMMVCGNPNLNDLDSKVDRAYQKAQQGLSPKDAEEVQRVQAAWMRGREKCQQNSDPTKCLEDYYQRRIKEIVQPQQ